MSSPPLLPFPLTICGIDELPGHAQAGVSHVLTILDPEWPDPEHFKLFAPHRRTIWRFHDIVNPQEGQQRPAVHNIKAILEYGTALQDQPVSHLLIHCHMGISRSTATAAILMAQHNPGREDEVFSTLRQVRPRSWPNSHMIAMADAMLGREGALVAAMKGHHKTMTRVLEPHMLDYLKASERGSEVPED